jgi:CheY-like chemotaxis protein
MSARHKLLIVDDDEAVIEYLRAKLGARYDIVSTTVPEKVIGLAREERPNLILCDVDMPDMDGGDVSKQLYADAEVRDIPVLFITALMTASDMKNTDDQIGGRPAISKQAPPEELAKRIASLTAKIGRSSRIARRPGK